MKVSNSKNKPQVSFGIVKTFGFTLIEVVIAIAILSIIGTVTYSALTQIIRSKNTLDDRRELNAVAYSVLNRMIRELQLSYSGIGLLPRPDETDGKQKPSNINMSGEPKTMSNGKHGDSIRFLALEGGQYLPDGGTHSGLVQIMYRVEENPEKIDSEIQSYILVREETPLIRPFEKAFSKVMNFPIVDSLVGLELRYFDPESESWLAEWNIENKFGLPNQIEIKIELLSPRGETHLFVTSVPIRSINITAQGSPN